MKTNKGTYTILFGPGGCLTRETIVRYINKTLSDKELTKVKKHASHCELCADALEGSVHFNSGHYFNQAVAKIRFEGKHNYRNSRDRSTRIFYRFAAAAASLALLFGLYYISRFSQLIDQNSKMAQHSKAVDSEIVSETLPIDAVKPIAENSISTSESNYKKQEINLAVPVYSRETQLEEDFEISMEVADEHVPTIVSPNIGENSVQVPAENFGYFAQVQSNEQSVAENQSVEAESRLQDNIKTTKEKTSRKRSLQQAKQRGKDDGQTIYYMAEVLPMFRGGGVDKFEKYIADSLKVVLPDSVLRQSIVVSFCINTSGNVQDVKLIRGTDSQILNSEVMHMIENSPEWIPAYMSGKPVTTQQQLELVFNK